MIPPNDWEIKRCLYLSLATLVAMLGLVGLAGLGFDIPVLRQIIGFAFLTFVPGVLILRILKLHNLGIIESLVYSVGLSLAFVMLSGAFINFVFPFMGISKPISLIPLAATSAVFTLILMAVAYMRDRAFIGLAETVPGNKLRLPSVLLLTLLLLLTVLGVAIVDAYQNNTVLLIVILAVAGVIGLATFGKLIEPRVYPLAIFTIGLCLLYQTTLMSPHLIGSDIHSEYYYYRLVADSGLWNASIASSVNSCLSIVILAPVYSLLLNIDGVWMFKAIYPLLFALVPLILFHIFSQQMSYKKSFLAAFFFVAVPTFSLEMIGVCRQQIAELFLVLLILLLVDRKLNSGPKLALAIIFATSIVVSHYALGFIGFIYMGLLLPVAIIRSGVFQKAWGWLTRKPGSLPRSLTVPKALPAKVLVVVVVIYFMIGFAWYGTTASGVNLRMLSGIWTAQIETITTGLAELGPGPTEPAPPGPTEPTKPTKPPLAFFQFGQRAGLIQTALGLDFPQASPQGKGFRILQYITQLFLIAGCLRLIFRPKQLRFTAEYVALSVTSALLILVCIFVPYFANALNTTRWYHIALITLAPFCILGGEAIWLGVSSLWQKLRRRTRGLEFAEDSQGYLKFLVLVVLIPYFLFTSGFIYEVTGQKVTDKIDAPYSIALSSYRLALTGNLYWRDEAGADWLAPKLGDESIVQADSAGCLFLSGRPEFHNRIGSLDLEKLTEGMYAFLTSWNIEKREISVNAGIGLRRSFSFDELGLDDTIKSKNRIYNNGGTQILAPFN
jgi:uncharacterized membrane protein